MSVSCLLSHTYHDLRCPVCGEGFLILAAEAATSVSRAVLQRRVSDALRSHHTTAGATHVHPTHAFPVESDRAVAQEAWLTGLFPLAEGDTALIA